MTLTQTDRREIKIRLRLARGLTGMWPLCGFYHPDDQAIVKRLEQLGQVTTQIGEGRDRGLLLARLTSRADAGAATADGGSAA